MVCWIVCGACWLHGEWGLARSVSCSTGEQHLLYCYIVFISLCHTVGCRNHKLLLLLPPSNQRLPLPCHSLLSQTSDFHAASYSQNCIIYVYLQDWRPATCVRCRSSQLVGVPAAGANGAQQCRGMGAAGADGPCRYK
jgi:hypothetical protein